MLPTVSTPRPVARQRLLWRGWLSLASLGLVLFAWPAPGFSLSGPSQRWPANTAVVLSLQLGSRGLSPLDDGSTDFDAVATSAAALWNNVLGSNVRIFTPVSGTVSSASDADSVCNVFFASTFFGSGFGDAIAITGTSGGAEGFEVVDVVFSSLRTWNSYRGPLRRNPTEFDFRRVAIHEFGHVLGLDHPDQATPPQSVRAIMNSAVSDVDVMQADDIAGVHALYGAPTPTPPPPALPGVSFAAGTSLPAARFHLYSTPGEPVAAGRELDLGPAQGVTVRYRTEAEAGTARTRHIFTVAGATGERWAFVVTSPAGVGELRLGTFNVNGTTRTNADSYDLSVLHDDGAAVDAQSSLASAQLQIRGATYAGGVPTSLALDFRLAGSATAAPQFLAGQLRFQTDVPLPAARMVNLSTRVDVGRGTAQAIAGFVFRDSAGVGKQALVRVIGPTLANFGLSSVLGDPTVQLNDATGRGIGFNDDWANPDFYAPPQAPVIALGLTPLGRTESILFQRFATGAYTAVVAGYDNGQGPETGLAVVELYDLEIGSEATLLNVSTRGLVGTGARAMIGGFVLVGPGSKNVIVRALGPSLSAFGVSGALADPTVTVFDASGSPIATNDDWQSDARAASVTARGLAPSNAVESALYLTLPPGSYTAVVRGKNNTTGTALVEVYDAD